MISKKNNYINLLIGPMLFFLCIYLLPEKTFNSFEIKAAIGTACWMSFWWISSCISYAVTAFLPIVINAIFSIVNMNSLLSNYASEIFILLLGASLLTVSWETTGVDKRIAYNFLALIGTSITSQITFWFFLTVIMSSVLPNSVVCITVTPIAVSMLKHVGITDFKTNPVSAVILLTIAWGSGLGGLASPLGGAMNLVIIDYIETHMNSEFLYIDWVVKFLPIMVVLIISNLIFLQIIKPKKVKINGTKEYFSQELKKLGKLKKEEGIIFALFIIATTLSFSRSFYADLLPNLKPAYIFIICGLTTFLVNNENKTRLIKWSDAQKKINWELIFIFSGGLALGTLINDSNAAATLGELIASFGIVNDTMLILLILIFTIVLSDFTSNTATAAVAIPIVLSLTTGMHLNPIPYIFIASIGVNLSYCMPTSIRAIPVGFGLSTKYMFKHGLKLTLIVIILMTITSWLLLNYWPYFIKAS